MMVDFSKLELNKLIPIYIQIIRHVKMEIVAENVKNGDEMPSRRVLSTMLSVNPNTVQKAYKQMEEEGMLISYPGSKSILVVNEEIGVKLRHELISYEILSFVDAVKGMGLTLEQTKTMLEKYWDIDQQEGD